MTELLVCAQCGFHFLKDVGQANRQRKVLGAAVRFFCTRQCFAASRRIEKDQAVRVAEKAVYDREYRARNRAMLKAKKAEYFQRTYDPQTAAVQRKAVLAWHREYTKEYRSRPEWIAHKAEYDQRLRAAECGEFAECHMILVELEREIRTQQPDRYQRAKERGYYDNFRTTQQRKRNEGVYRW